MHNRWILAFVFFAMVFADKSWATHATVSSGTGQTGPITTIAAPTLPEGKWSLELQSEFLWFKEFSDNKLRRFAESGEDVHSVESVSNTSFGIGYGITDDLTVGVRIPYVIRTDIKEAHHDEPEEVHHHGDANGIGDLSILGRYRFAKWTNKDFESTLVFGLKLPTGATTDKDNDGIRLETEFQPGSGSWDAMAGISMTERFKHLTLDANILYTFVTEGSQNTDLGDVFNYNMALCYRPLKRPVSWDLIAEINGVWRAKQKIGGVKDDNSGGNIVFLSPGMRFSWNRWMAYFSVGLPVIQDNNGIQNDTDIRAVGGIGLAF